MAPRGFTVSRKWDDLDEYAQELEWRKCFEVLDVEHCRYFLENYWTIKVPGSGRQLFELREAQIEVLKTWLTAKESITLKARQIGYSTLAGAISAWLAIGFEDLEILTLSRNGRESRKQLKDRIKYGIDDLPANMVGRRKVIADTIETLSFDHGSSIICLPSNNPARGYSAFIIFVDEAAFFEKFDEAWAAIEPAADIGGRIHTLSTANGIGNGYHAMWVRATTTKNSGIVPLFYSWRAVPGRNDEWYERQKRKLPEWQLNQEYPSTPEEAFIKSGRPVFDVLAFEGIEIEPAIVVGYLIESESNERVVGHRESPDGELSVWELPVAGQRYVVGADVAEGLDHGDWSVAYVIRADTGSVVAKWFGHIDPDSFGSEVLWALGWWYNGAVLGVEVNNHGFTTLQALKRRKYPRIFQRRAYDQRKDAKRMALGWRTDAASKRLLVDELREALRDGDICLFDADCGGDFGQLRTFVRDTNGKMHGSPHDDLVMALGIAVQMLKHVQAAAALEEERQIHGTFAELEWRLEREARAQRFIGATAHRRDAFALG